jgi:glycosyltransferase involved in cell wall biosynthesis
MSVAMRDVTAIVVNYGTFRLTRNAIWSLHSLYPDLEILAIENGSPDDSAARLRNLEAEVEPLSVIVSETNLHHGPGMDAGIRRIETAWALLFDSDSLAFRKGFIENMSAAALDSGAYMVGQRLLVDDSGFVSDCGGPYIHPHCALINREQYLSLAPFERHGAPCLRNARDAAGRGLKLADFPVGDYVYHIGRGTVDLHGYQLGSRSKIDRLRALLARTFRRS